MTRVYLSLGSNMGDRQGYLQKAVKAYWIGLPETEVKAVSSYYEETAAWGLTINQADFLNLALALRHAVAGRDLAECHVSKLRKIYDSRSP